MSYKVFFDFGFTVMAFGIKVHSLHSITQGTAFPPSTLFPHSGNPEHNLYLHAEEHIEECVAIAEAIRDRNL